MGNVVNIKKDDYQLFLLPGRCPPDYAAVDFHNEVFQFWKNFWTEVFAENKTNSVPDANIFYRQQTVAVITRGREIVGTLFCTENNLASAVTQEISYFSRPHIKEFCEQLRNDGLHRVATYEMLSVAPSFRRSLTGISFGKVLLGLVVEVFRSLRADIMIGPVRLDNSVRALVEEFGWRVVSEEYSMHGTPVAISALSKKEAHGSGDVATESLIRRLWNEKHDWRLEKENLDGLKRVA